MIFLVARVILVENYEDANEVERTTSMITENKWRILNYVGGCIH